MVTWRSKKTDSARMWGLKRDKSPSRAGAQVEHLCIVRLNVLAGWFQESICRVVIQTEATRGQSASQIVKMRERSLLKSMLTSNWRTSCAFQEADSGWEKQPNWTRSRSECSDQGPSPSLHRQRVSALIFLYSAYSLDLDWTEENRAHMQFQYSNLTSVLTE